MKANRVGVKEPEEIHLKANKSIFRTMLNSLFSIKICGAEYLSKTK